jgi:phosphomannomutase
LELMGVGSEVYCEPNGHFHTTRTFERHLTDISELVVKEKADLGCR